MNNDSSNSVILLFLINLILYCLYLHSEYFLCMQRRKENLIWRLRYTGLACIHNLMHDKEDTVAHMLVCKC